MEIGFGCVVEGHGEVESVGVLIRRIVQEIDATVSVKVPVPVRQPRSTLLRADGLEREVQLAHVT